MPSRIVVWLLACQACLAGMTSSAWAWGHKEHLQLTRLAAMRLRDDPATPPGMRQWLIEQVPGLGDLDAEREYFLHARVGLFPREPDGVAYWSTIPDMVAMTDRPEKTVEPFGVHERLLHYLDLELLHPDESKRAYQADLSGRPSIDQIPRDMSDPRYKTAGMLPFRVEQTYGQLIASLRAGRRGDSPGQYPRDDHAARWAGYLSHYLADNTQPHHATVDYKSASAFADPAGAPSVHAEIEYRMCDDEDEDFPALREAYWALLVEALKTVEDPAPVDDPWLGSVRTSWDAYEALPLIAQAAAAAARPASGPSTRPALVLDTQAFFAFRGAVGERQMTVLQLKAQQQALAVHRIAAHWLSAWNAAHAVAAPISE